MDYLAPPLYPSHPSPHPDPNLLRSGSWCSFRHCQACAHTTPDLQSCTLRIEQVHLALFQRTSIFSVSPWNKRWNNAILLTIRGSLYYRVIFQKLNKVLVKVLTKCSQRIFTKNQYFVVCTLTCLYTFPILFKNLLDSWSQCLVAVSSLSQISLVWKKKTKRFFLFTWKVLLLFWMSPCVLLAFIFCLIQYSLVAFAVKSITVPC